MNIEELIEEYKDKLDELMKEYKEKVKELEETKEEPFIKKGQGYFCIRADFTVSNTDAYSNDSFDKIMLGCGNCYPFTDDNYEEVLKEVNLIAERRKLQSEMEMFARLNNAEKIDWDNNKENWFIYIDYEDNHIGIDRTYHYRELNATYFSSEQVAQKAYEKFKDRIRELYIDMEK